MSLRKLAIPLVAIALGFLIPVVLLEVFLRFLPVSTGLASVAVNAANPIARFEPNRDFVFSKEWNFILANRGHVNNDGFVNDQDYHSTSTTPLMAVVGDSYVEAAMVPYPMTLQGRLSRYVAHRGRVYSFGTSGSPLSQYLAFADYARATYHPTVLIIPVVGNDFDESLFKYKSVPGFHLFHETPEGRLELKCLDHTPSATRKFFRHSALARYLFFNLNVATLMTSMGGGGASTGGAPTGGASTGGAPTGGAPTGGAPVFVGNTLAQADATRISDSKRAIDAFFAEMPARSGLDPKQVLFLVDGIRPELYTGDGLKATEGTYFDQMRRYFLAAARAREYEAIDLQPLFIARYRQEKARFEHPRDGHWNILGHALAAEAVVGSAVYRREFGQ